MSKTFYDELTPFYHLIYPDWEKSVERQGEQIDSIIKKYSVKNVKTVLDVSCGIGTQALGLALKGYDLTASDLSSKEIERAKLESGKRNLSISFSVADMRNAYSHHKRQFDAIISMDNSVPHLLTKEDILQAFQEFYSCLNRNGLCIISVRDYEKEKLSGCQIKPYGFREYNGKKYLLLQTWEFSDKIYNVSFYIIEDNKDKECKTHVMRSKYFAITIEELICLFKKAGFRRVIRNDNSFFQPVLIAVK